jgi:hypothetical protein
LTIVLSVHLRCTDIDYFLFLLTIVLSVRHRCTDIDYFLGIFKLFL